MQRATFAEQLHNGDDHVEYRPGGGENDHRKRRHLPSSLTRRFETIFASQIVKIPEPGSIFSVVRPEAAVPPTKTGMEKVVCLRKASLAARGRTPRFHRL